MHSFTPQTNMSQRMFDVCPSCSYWYIFSLVPEKGKDDSQSICKFTPKEVPKRILKLLHRFLSSVNPSRKLKKKNFSLYSWDILLPDEKKKNYQNHLLCVQVYHLEKKQSHAIFFSWFFEVIKTKMKLEKRHGSEVRVAGENIDKEDTE